MLNLPGDTGHITIYLLSSFAKAEPPVGVTRVPLRQCREIRTVENDHLAGWYIERTQVAILRNGLFVGLLFLLPNNEPLLSPCEDLGIKAGLVQIGQLLALDEIRIIHPQARPIVLGA